MATGVELATAYVSLTVDGSGVDSGVRRSLSGVSAQADRVGRDSGKKMGAGISGGVLSSVGKVAGPIAAIFAGIGVGKILSDSITSGSDLQQALGGAEAVFKKDAAKIKATAEDAADAIGLPKSAYLELATVLGAGLKNKGVTDFAGETEKLITIGGDLAAQFGGPTTDAVDAIASAMRGESDPIEKYGISLNETAVNAKLTEMGLKKVNGRFTEQQKTAGRLALITQQAADAQGAFARESDTYAGSQARLSATWDNVKAQIGTALLPALTDLSQWFLTKGLPAVQKFGGWVKDELWPALKDGWETVRPGLEKAKEIIMGAFGGESSGSVEGFAGFITDTLIPGIATFVNVWLPVMATQLRATIEAVKLTWAAFITWRDTVAGVAASLLGYFISIVEGFQSVLTALGKVPGFGWAKTAAEDMQGVIDKANGVKAALESIPLKRTIEIVAQVSMPGRITLPGGGRVNIGLRELGGPVRKGQPYIVGEKRPELFVPNSNGKILPRVPDSGSAPAAMGGFDYGRMAAAVADAVEGVRPVVDTRDNARAVAQYQSRRARR